MSCYKSLVVVTNLVVYDWHSHSNAPYRNCWLCGLLGDISNESHQGNQRKHLVWPKFLTDFYIFFCFFARLGLTILKLISLSYSHPRRIANYNESRKQISNWFLKNLVVLQQVLSKTTKIDEWEMFSSLNQECRISEHHLPHFLAIFDNCRRWWTTRTVYYTHTLTYILMNFH